MTTLSLVMVSYNGFDKVRRCLSSWIPFVHAGHVTEWLILDNGSTDGTLQWLHNLARQVKKARIIKSPTNLGCCGGRKQLFAAATGDVILSLDADVLLRNRNGVASMLHTLTTRPEVGIVGDHGGWVKRDWSWTEEAPKKYVGPVPIVTGYCQMFRRDILKTVELDLAYSPYWLEDSDFCLQLVTRLKQTGWVLPAGVHHAWSKTNSGKLIEQRAKWAYFRNKWQHVSNPQAFCPTLK